MTCFAPMGLTPLKAYGIDAHIITALAYGPSSHHCALQSRAMRTCFNKQALHARPCRVSCSGSDPVKMCGLAEHSLSRLVSS